MPGPAGGRERMHLRDLGLSPGATVRLAIRAVDAAGNAGPPAEIAAKVSGRRPKPLPPDSPGPADPKGTNPRLRGAEVAILDELDKVDPVRGTTIPATSDDYLRANHLWDARDRRIRLHAARNEFVAFQVVVRGGAIDVAPSSPSGPGRPGAPRVEIGRYGLVPAKGGWLPDPIVGLDMKDRPVPGRTCQSLHVEVYVPHDAAPGEQTGTLTLRSGDQTSSST